MKTVKLLFSLLLFTFFLSNAQHSNIEVPTSINTTGNAPNASAILDIQDTNKGLLTPRMTSIQRGNILNPAEGLLVFDTSTNSFWFYNQSEWIEVSTTGVFENNNGVVRNTGNNATNDFVFGSSALPSFGSFTGSLMFFDKSKAAFRGGSLNSNDAWSSSQIGINSFAYGLNTTALGSESFAVGNSTNATGTNASAMGILTNATGNYSLATGYGSAANGYYSTASGVNTIANGLGSTVVGLYNYYIVQAPQTTTITPETPLFVVGNGNDDQSRSNALVVRKDGRTGVDNNFPDGTLHVGHQDGATMFIGSGGEDITDEGFFEISIDATLRPLKDNTDDLGNSTYRYNNVYLSGGVVNTSDKRLKKNITNIRYGLDAIMKMQAVKYQWIDQKDEQYKLGLIAQDVLEIAPEVVKTHGWKPTEESKDNTVERKTEKVELDRLGIYYTDIIPILIQAIQDQQQIIEAQATEIDELKEMKSEIEKLKRLLNSVSE